MQNSNFIRTSSFLRQTISLLIGIFLIIPIYVEYDFLDSGETIFLCKNFVLAIVHIVLSIFWIVYLVSKNKILKVISQTFILTISILYGFTASAFVFGNAKHIYPNFGSYLLFAYFPLMLIYFIQVKNDNYNGS